MKVEIMDEAGCLMGVVSSREVGMYVEVADEANALQFKLTKDSLQELIEALQWVGKQHFGVDTGVSTVFGVEKNPVPEVNNKQIRVRKILLDPDTGEEYFKNRSDQPLPVISRKTDLEILAELDEMTSRLRQCLLAWRLNRRSNKRQEALTVFLGFCKDMCSETELFAQECKVEPSTVDAHQDDLP